MATTKKPVGKKTPTKKTPARATASKKPVAKAHSAKPVDTVQLNKRIQSLVYIFVVLCIGFAVLAYCRYH